MTLANLIDTYGQKYDQFFGACIKESAELPCTVRSALETLKILSTDFANRGPGCELSSYVYVAFKGSGLDTAAKEFTDSLEKNALDEGIKTVKKYAAELMGCIAGGIAYGAIGAFSSRAGGLQGGILRAALIFPIGCAAGSKLVSKINSMHDNWQKLKKFSDLKAQFDECVRTLKDHHSACEAQENLNRMASVDVQAQIKPEKIEVYLAPNTMIPTKPTVLRSFKQSFTLSKNLSADYSFRTIAYPKKSNPLPSKSSFFDIDATAQKIVDIAGDLTGTTPLVDDGKRLKKLFTDIYSHPESAPKRIVKSFIEKPEKIFEDVLQAPEKFVSSSEAFLSDPTITGALSVVGKAFTIVTLANEILPVLTTIKGEIGKNPLSVPAIVSKELLNLTFNKILGINELAKGLHKNPLQVCEQTIKEIVNSPKQFVKNVKRLFGAKGKTKSKAKRKAKRRAKELISVQRSMHAYFQEQDDKLKATITEVMPICYEMARNRWMRSEDQTIECYFSALTVDWKQEMATGKINSDFPEFILQIANLLETGNLSEVARISPTAHLTRPTPPPIVNRALVNLAQATKLLERVNLQRKNEIEEVKKLTVLIAEENQRYSDTNSKLETLLAADGERIARIVQKRIALRHK